MGISVWQILILLVLLVPPFFVIGMTKKADMSRGLYFANFVLILVVGLIIDGLSRFTGPVDPMGVLGSGAIFALGLFLFRLSARRAIDGGLSRWWALIIVIPFAFLILTLIPSKEARSTD